MSNRTVRDVLIDIKKREDNVYDVYITKRWLGSDVKTHIGSKGSYTEAIKLVNDILMEDSEKGEEV